MSAVGHIAGKGEKCYVNLSLRKTTRGGLCDVQQHGALPPKDDKGITSVICVLFNNAVICDN